MSYSSPPPLRSSGDPYADVNTSINTTRTATSTTRHRTSSKSPLRSSLGRHVPGSVYCITAGLHHHTQADLNATKTPPRRLLSASSSSHKRNSRPRSAQHGSHTESHTHTHTHTHADYTSLVAKLDRMTIMYNQLLADEQMRAHGRHSELEHERELRLQQRLAESEALLRQQLIRERDDERKMMEQRLAERDQMIVQLETQLAIARNSDNATIHSLRLEVDKLKLDYIHLKRDSETRITEMTVEMNRMTADDRQLRDDLSAAQKAVLASTEDNLRLRYQIKDLTNRLHNSETHQQRLERLTMEREEDEARLAQLRKEEADDRLRAEKRLKQQLAQQQAILERNRLKAMQDEQDSNKYYIDGECAWQSGILNRSLLLIPTASHTG